MAPSLAPRGEDSGRDPHRHFSGEVTGVTEDKSQELSPERPVAQAPPTGDARVDEAVAQLSRLHGQAAQEHVAILEEVHGRLRDILDELAESPGPDGPESR